MLSKLVRTLFCFALLACLWFVFSAGRQAEEFSFNAEKFSSLPDVDYRLMAEEYWAGGNSEAALACLEYVISNKLADSPASKILYEKYLKSIRERKSAFGRVLAFGKGFALGDTDGVDSIAGCVVADLLVYGDVRDFINEGFVKDDGDNFILAMSTIGLATTFFPPADSGVSLLKLLAKTNSISEPLKKTFTKTAKIVGDAVKNPALKSGAAAEISKSIEPVADLAKHTSSWTQFSSVMKNASSISEVKSVAKLLKNNPANAAKLDQILQLSRYRAQEMLHVVSSGGQSAMDKVYSVLRKGPRGFAFVAKHPAFTARSAKNIYKSYPLAKAFVAQKIAENIFYKYAAYGILSVLMAFALVPFGGAYSWAKSMGAGAFKAFVSAVALFAIVSCLIFCGVCLADSKLIFPAAEVKKTSGSVNANAYLGYAIWNVELLIEEDYWINDKYEKSFLGVHLKIGDKTFVVCDSELLGLFWGESSKGGVYTYEISVQRRGDNPLSFIPEAFYILKSNPHFALIPVPDKFAEELSLKNFSGTELPLGEKAILFTPKSGFSSSAPIIGVEEGKIVLYAKGDSSKSDLLTTTPRGLFLGMICADKKKTIYIQQALQFNPENYEKVSLKQTKGQIYFKDFSDISKRAQKR